MQRKLGRTPQGRPSRLKPVEQDPLAEYGLPSKGEKRLLSPKVQESYYSKIVERYLAFCTEAGDRDTLQKQFARLSVTDTTKPSTPFNPRGSSLSTPLPVPHNNDALSQILSALRKLREALVASHRTDDFAIQVYLFSVRLGIQASSFETYLPSLLHLLRRHANQPQRTPLTPQPTTTAITTTTTTTTLTTLEQTEITTYLILDTACRRGDLAHALSLLHQHFPSPPSHPNQPPPTPSTTATFLKQTLLSLIHDNWILFRRTKSLADGYKAKIMEFAERRVREHTLKVWGRAYLGLPMGVVEREMGMGWGEVVGVLGVGWEVESEGGEKRVVIRRVGRK